tara:strand:- start:286 stop:525 length:240 start_codon:yes stop_codon:yes gene_type:complete
LEINKMKMIIYKKDDGGVAIVIPTNEGLEKLGGINNLAKRDVPTGKKYKIVDESEISSDRTFRNAWEINESELTDGVGD